MKTNGTLEAPAAASQPGNLTVRQLAQSLKTTAAAKPENETATESEAQSREDTPPVEGKETAATEESQNGESTPPENAETETTADSTAAANETETTEAAESTEETIANAEPAISEAMAQRIDAELKPLIEELTQAGAKGALQILQKRIPKLVDQRDTERNARLAAEEQAAGLRQELQAARSQKPEANGHTGTVHPAVAKAAAELGNVDHWLGWCEENPEGGEVPDGKGGKMELTEAQVRQLRREMEHERTEIVARKVQTEREVRTEYERQFTQHHTAAIAEYPWMSNANAPENQEMQAVLKVFPQFKAAPDYELAIGDFIAGKALRLAKAKAKANGTVLPRKPAPQREPTRVVAEPPASSAARKAPGAAKKDEADAQFQKSGSVRDLAKSFSASRRASRTGA